MLDRSTSLIVEGLTKALGASRGLPLIGSRTRPGLFAAAAAARQAAQLCKNQGLIEVVGTEKAGKSSLEICKINDKGLAFLLTQTSPRPILEQIARRLEERHDEIAGLNGAAESIRDELDGLKAVVEKALHHAPHHTNGNGVAPTKDPGLALRAALGRWDGRTDCPLPELYRRLEPTFPHWTIGRFHDQLRAMREEGLIYLHPWTGPLYEIPEPQFALLIGHEVAYYLSPRG